jgi:hypothetical protein
MGLERKILDKLKEFDAPRMEFWNGTLFVTCDGLTAVAIRDKLNNGRFNVAMSNFGTEYSFDFV